MVGWGRDTSEEKEKESVEGRGGNFEKSIHTGTSKGLSGKEGKKCTLIPACLKKEKGGRSRPCRM